MAQYVPIPGRPLSGIYIYYCIDCYKGDVPITHISSVLHLQITIHSDHAEYPDLKLTTFGTRKIFERLREVLGPVTGLCCRQLPLVSCFAPHQLCIVLLNLDNSCGARRGPERGSPLPLIISMMGIMKHNGPLGVRNGFGDSTSNSVGNCQLPTRNRGCVKLPEPRQAMFMHCLWCLRLKSLPRSSSFLLLCYNLWLHHGYKSSIRRVNLDAYGVCISRRSCSFILLVSLPLVVGISAYTFVGSCA